MKKLIASIASSALLLQLFAGVGLAAMSCSITANGSSTTNNCDFTVSRNVDVNQNNDMDVDNDVDIDQDSGNNEVEDNLGEVSVNTGNNTSDVTLTTEGNTNAASAPGTSAQDFVFLIKNNLTGSNNTVDVDVTDRVDVDQDNDMDVDNDVDVDQDSGDNDVHDNLSADADPKVTTGNNSATIAAKTSGNGNAAVVGGSDDEGTFSATISANGADTTNDIDFSVLYDADVDQDNDADVDNDFDVDQDSGDNEVEDNLGEVSVTTGDNTADLSADTAVNFNSAEVMGGFLLGDIDLSIDQNLTDSTSSIDLDVTDDVDADQDNDADVDNDMDADQDSGDNDVDSNLGEVTEETGANDTTVANSTSGNSNIFGGEVEFDADLQEVLEDLLSALLSMLSNN